MKEYIYIPRIHESILAEAVDVWTSAPNYGWTIIIGIYSASQVFEEGNSLVKNVLRENRQEVLIPYGIAETFFSDQKTLIGFCLEGDLDLYAPNFKAILQNFADVKFFENANDYLEYINDLK